jgi:hypothetical protein
MLEMNELRKGVADAMTSVSVSYADYLAKEAAAGVGAELVQTALRESAKEVVGAIAGPLFRILCRVIDTSQRKLDTLIAQPFATGARIAMQVPKVVPLSEGDEEFARRQLESATAHLEEALSHATRLKQPDEVFTIQFLLTLLAVRRGSWAFARNYFEPCLPKFQRELRLEEAIVECLQAMEHGFQNGRSHTAFRRANGAYLTADMAGPLLFDYLGKLGSDVLQREIDLLGLSHTPSFAHDLPGEYERQRSAYFMPRFTAAIDRRREEHQRLKLFIESLASPES